MKATLNDPALLEVRERHMARLAGLLAGQRLEGGLFLQGVTGAGKADPYAEPEQWVEQALADLAARAGALRDPAVFRPLCLEFNPYGVHFIDRMFGARVYHHADQWWSRPLGTPVGELAPPDLDRDETWRLARRIAAAFLAAGVAVPLFGLPTIASALNVAVNLYDEEFLVALAAHPAAVRRDLGVINDLLCHLHRWYRQRIPAQQLQPVVAAQRCQPPGFGQLCGCTTHLLSADMYRRFVAPVDDELLSVYPHGGMIHLCGDHLRHAPAWREMKSLRAVQVNDRAAEDLPAWLEHLRDDQVIYLNPTATMTPKRALDLAAGRRLVIVAEPSAVVGG
jgi:hypothetical protein